MAVFGPNLGATVLEGFGVSGFSGSRVWDVFSPEGPCSPYISTLRPKYILCGYIVAWTLRVLVGSNLRA